jgi:hypothetical protein
VLLAAAVWDSVQVLLLLAIVNGKVPDIPTLTIEIQVKTELDVECVTAILVRNNSHVTSLVFLVHLDAPHKIFDGATKILYLDAEPVQIVQH